ncbi:hypothetical protein Bbelb_047170 [Branchiostoma belcheri]|nr:hypothetical protein Bbelb_047170 [Branchiostoma belcheri]
MPTSPACDLGKEGKKYDLLERLRVPDLPHGIRQTCDDADCLAYDIEPYAMLSAPTEEVFPEGVSVPDLDDGLWHSFAVSATYDMIVFYFDCEWMDTLHIVPSPHYIQMDGITLLGGQVDFSEVPFEDLTVDKPTDETEKEYRNYS